MWCRISRIKSICWYRLYLPPQLHNKYCIVYSLKYHLAIPKNERVCIACKTDSFYSHTILLTKITQRNEQYRCWKTRRGSNLSCHFTFFVKKLQWPIILFSFDMLNIVYVYWMVHLLNQSGLDGKKLISRNLLCLVILIPI